VERLLDRVEGEHPELRIVRLRPALIFQRRAAREITRYFVARRFPAGIIPPRAELLIDAISPMRFQVVHAVDVARAVCAAVADDEARGAYNLATEPVLGRERPVVAAGVRGIVSAAWHGHLIPTDPGWIDLARSAPLMSTARARDELGWSPTRDARSTLGELLGGMRRRATGPTPVLASDEDGGAVQPDGTSAAS
jgi:nucleoside-diphosphate-sugar epimerase